MIALIFAHHVPWSTIPGNSQLKDVNSGVQKANSIKSFSSIGKVPGFLKEVGTIFYVHFNRLQGVIKLRWWSKWFKDILLGGGDGKNPYLILSGGDDGKSVWWIKSVDWWCIETESFFGLNGLVV